MLEPNLNNRDSLEGKTRSRRARRLTGVSGRPVLGRGPSPTDPGHWSASLDGRKPVLLTYIYIYGQRMYRWSSILLYTHHTSLVMSLYEVLQYMKLIWHVLRNFSMYDVILVCITYF